VEPRDEVTVVTAGNHAYDIVFLGLARDCASTLPGSFRALERLGNAGLGVHLFVGENGSKDNTRSLLERAVHNGQVTVVDTSFMSSAQNRLHRMAVGRERLASEIKSLGHTVNVVGVVDLDEPFLAQLDPDLVATQLERLDDPELFGVSATSRPSYYDLLAFEDEKRSYTYLDRRIKELRRHPVQYYRLFRDVLYTDQERLTSSEDILCTSAFNGLALYKAATFVRGSYLPPYGGPWICEHVTFNRSLAAATGKHMLVNGALVMPAPPEHRRRSLPGFVLQRAAKLAGRVTAHLG
jgi:hypothetical protein